MHANIANYGNSGDRPSERCCQVCNCNINFKKMLHLDTGLVIYLHRMKSSVYDEGPVQVLYPRKEDTLILHNTSQTELQKDVTILELSKYKTKCTMCRSIVHRVRSLLEEIRAMRRSEAYAACEHCMGAGEVKCKRCAYILAKFHDDRKKRLEERDQRLSLWSCKVQLLLESILNGPGRHRASLDGDENELEKLLAELKPPLPRGQAWPENLCQSKEMLREIIVTIKLERLRKHYTSEDSLYVSHSRGFCACPGCKGNLYQGRNTVADLSEKIPALESPTKSQFEIEYSKSKYKSSEFKSSQQSKPSEDTTESRKISVSEPPMKSHSDEKNSKSKSKLSMVKSSKQSKPFEDTTESRKISALEPPIKSHSDKENTKSKSKLSKVKSSKQSKPSEDTTESRKISALEPPMKSHSDKENSESKSKLSKVKSSKQSKTSEDTTKSKKANKDNSIKKKKRNKSEMYFEKLIKKFKAEQRKQALKDKAEAMRSKRPSGLPKPIKYKSLKLYKFHKNLESSVFEDNISNDTCYEDTPKIKEVMIKGIKIIPLEERDISLERDKTVDISCLDKLKSAEERSGPVSKIDKTGQDHSGVIMYRLSDRKFIDNGWTQLPTVKVFRRMNIYRMLPSSPNWFEQHNGQTLMFYGSGEKLAQIEARGGKWFYKNGRVALDYYDFDDETRRYMVYSYADNSAKAQTILACFDYLGNGIVFDNCGNERLKYNQSEGIVIDKKIGPPGVWKWHSLNDPPILQEMFVDTHPKNPSPELEEIIREEENKAVCLKKQYQSHVHMHPLNRESKSVLHCGQIKDDMLETELQNYAKQKHRKLLQRFERFQIRMKTVKINDYFSLRVIDQSNIYLLFRDRALTLKLNLGMLLQSDEIIDLNVYDIKKVVITPYDQDPPNSKCFKKEHDAFQAARASFESKQIFPTKRPSSAVCPLPPLGVSSDAGRNSALSPPNSRCSLNLPRWRSADTYRQASSSPLGL